MFDSVELNNWQSYRGDQNKFEFSGPDSTRNSAIIIGRNGKGKSAFFESLRFLLYGGDTIVVRESTTKPKRVKPKVAEKKSDKPLMCWEAWNSGERSFGVKANVRIEGKQYTIERKYTSTKKKPSEEDLKEEFYILEDSNKKKVAKPEDFVNNLLPEGITKFFTIDGELLMEYRRIFDSERAGLASDLERILRMGILDSATFQTNAVKKTLESRKRKQDRKRIAEGELKKELEKLDSEIDEVAEKITKSNEKIKNLEDEYEELLEWQKTKGNTTAHLAKLEDINDEKSKTNEEINRLLKKRGNQFANGWKQVLARKVRTAIDAQTEILDRQKKNSDEAAELESKITSRKNLLAGDPCFSCGQEKAKLSPEEGVKISDEIDILQIKMDSLNEQSQTPEPWPVMERRESLRTILTDLPYSDTHELSKQIADLEIKLVTLDNDRKATLKGMDEKALEMGRKKKTRLAIVSSDLESEREKLRLHLRVEEDLSHRRKIRGGGENSNQDETEPDDLKKQIDIADLLIGLCNDAKFPFRDSTRRSVSAIAEETYLKLIDEDHDRLEFDSQFRVNVYEDGGKSDVILTPGQMGLATYCILEALSIVADIDFPLIVDSPGQGIDMEYMGQICEHILEQSGRQVIVMPNTSEVDAENCIEDYGSSLSAIYQVNRPRGTKETIINSLHRREK